MQETLWLLIVAGGPLVLAILIGYALFRKRSLTPREKAVSDKATRRLYDEKTD
jgi:uncharacterized membrane protein